MLAGFGGQSSLMKADTLEGLTFFLKKEDLDESFKGDLLEIVLMLCKEKNRESYKGVLKFLKGFVKVSTKDVLADKLKSILVAILTLDERSRMS